jgi:hypothetical protein
MTKQTEAEIVTAQIAEVEQVLCDACEQTFAAQIIDEPGFHSSVRRTGPASLQLTFDTDLYEIVVRNQIAVRPR